MRLAMLNTPNLKAPLVEHVQHVVKITSLQRKQIDQVLELAHDVKKQPKRYSESAKQRSMVMLFEKPSLRTRLSFEIGMTQLGGHAINYELGPNATLGKKESIEDTARVIERYADIVMARVRSRYTIQKLAEYCTKVPIINGLDDYAHPCQILADLQTIAEKLALPTSQISSARKLTIAYLGDTANNVTYDWMRLSGLLGWHFRAAGPVDDDAYQPEQEVIDEVKLLNQNSGGSMKVTQHIEEALDGAEVVMTDSWMSYHLESALQVRREQLLAPYRVTSDAMKMAKKDAIFMHCLPASRKQEVTADVIDGPQSVVFDQAENRLHAQKALVIYLLHGIVNDGK